MNLIGLLEGKELGQNKPYSTGIWWAMFRTTIDQQVACLSIQQPTGLLSYAEDATTPVEYHSHLPHLLGLNPMVIEGGGC